MYHDIHESEVRPHNPAVSPPPTPARGPRKTKKILKRQLKRPTAPPPPTPTTGHTNKETHPMPVAEKTMLPLGQQLLLARKKMRHIPRPENQISVEETIPHTYSAYPEHPNITKASNVAAKVAKAKSVETINLHAITIQQPGTNKQVETSGAAAVDDDHLPLVFGACALPAMMTDGQETKGSAEASSSSDGCSYTYSNEVMSFQKPYGFRPQCQDSPHPELKARQQDAKFSYGNKSEVRAISNRQLATKCYETINKCDILVSEKEYTSLKID